MRSPAWSGGGGWAAPPPAAVWRAARGGSPPQRSACCAAGRTFLLSTAAATRALLWSYAGGLVGSGRTRCADEESDFDSTSRVWHFIFHAARRWGVGLGVGDTPAPTTHNTKER